MKKPVIIFGAGASYGSDSNGTPPLTINLIDQIAAYCPNTWGTLDQAAKNEFKNDFEVAMKNLVNARPMEATVLQRALAAYFFQFTPSPQNLYVTLMQKIKSSNWNGVIASLNYERLLEISSSLVGVGNTLVNFLLPHGCCHLFNKNARGMSSGARINALGATTNCGPNGLEIIRDANAFNTRITTDAFPPIMSYFVPEKATTSGRDIIDDQRLQFTTALLNATTVAVVGIKVREHDAHIWDHLAKTPGSILYCSGSDRTSFKNWSQKNNRSIDIAGNYFSDSFDQICTHVGIC